MRPTGYTTLHLVCDSSDRGYRRHGLVQALVKSGAELEATDPKGNTAFLLASGVGVTDVIDTLLTLGANVSAKNLKGMGAKQKALHHSSHVRTALSNRMRQIHTPLTLGAHGPKWDHSARPDFGELTRIHIGLGGLKVVGRIHIAQIVGRIHNCRSATLDRLVRIMSACT